MPQDAYAPGKHLILDISGASHLDELYLVENALLAAAKECAATVLKCELHSFGEGQGITGVLLLSESHMSIHTWPELSYAAIDVFLCGSLDVELTIPIFRKYFRAKEIKVRILERRPV